MYRGGEMKKKSEGEVCISRCTRERERKKGYKHPNARARIYSFLVLLLPRATLEVYMLRSYLIILCLECIYIYPFFHCSACACDAGELFIRVRWGRGAYIMANFRFCAWDMCE